MHKERFLFQININSFHKASLTSICQWSIIEYSSMNSCYPRLNEQEIYNNDLPSSSKPERNLALNYPTILAKRVKDPFQIHE